MRHFSTLDIRNDQQRSNTRQGAIQNVYPLRRGRERSRQSVKDVNLILTKIEDRSKLFSFIFPLCLLFIFISVVSFNLNDFQYFVKMKTS